MYSGNRLAGLLYQCTSYLLSLGLCPTTLPVTVTVTATVSASASASADLSRRAVDAEMAAAQSTVGSLDTTR